MLRRVQVMPIPKAWAGARFSRFRVGREASEASALWILSRISVRLMKIKHNYLCISIRGHRLCMNSSSNISEN